MTHSDVIIGHVVTLSVKLHQTAPDFYTNSTPQNKQSISKYLSKHTRHYFALKALMGMVYYWLCIVHVIFTLTQNH